MPIQVNCPACARPLRVPDTLIGQRVKCPGCRDQFVAEPSISTPAPPPEEFRAAGARPAPDEGSRRAPRRPRLDEDDDDDDFDRERRRDVEFHDDDDYRERQREHSVERARGKVAVPAITLIVMAFLNIGFMALSICGNIMNLNNNARPQNPFGGGPADPMAGIIYAGISVLLSFLIIAGSIKMKQLQAYGFALTAAVLAAIPCISPCVILGIPFGIWAFVVLMSSDVREAFS